MSFTLFKEYCKITKPDKSVFYQWCSEEEKSTYEEFGYIVEKYEIKLPWQR